MTWLSRFWRRNKLERDLGQELQFHIAERVTALKGAGMSEDQARRQVRQEFGGIEQVKEECRDARGTRWLEDLSQDIRFALRTLRKKPGFLLSALGTLAVGTAAVTVMFTLIHSVLLRPLPYPEADRLITVHGQSTTWNSALFGEQNVAYLDFRDCRRVSRSLDLAGFLYNGGTLSAPGEAEYVDRREISDNLFAVLQVRLFRGRPFLPEEDRPGAMPVIILGHALWQRRFGGNPDVIGTQVVIDDKPYNIVGIAASGFRLDGNEPDLYTPLGQDTAAYMQNRRPHPVNVVGRLRSGTTLTQARTEITMIGRHLADEYRDTNENRGFLVQSLRPDVGDVRSTLWLLLGAVSLVLLIACVNIASLLLARAISRGRELAVRVALGAARSRLIRQCLTESAVLGVLGGVLGIALAAVGLHPFVKFWPGSLPRADEVRLDWQVLTFALALSLFCGLLFGLAPALHAPTTKLEQTLRAGSRSVVGSSRKLHSGFVISQVAVAMVLLISSATLGRTLLRLSSLNPGIDTRNVLVTRVALAPGTLANSGRIRSAWQDILTQARGVPGVRSVAMVDTVPMRQGNNQLGYWTNADIPPENKQPVALATTVTPDYLKVMGIPLRQGRFLDDHDRVGSELVVVIDEVLARDAFHNRDPVGKRLWIPDMSSNPVRVVGVVGHVRHWGLAGDDQAPVRVQLYYPFGQVPDVLLRRWSELMSIAVRTEVPPLSVVSPLRQAIRAAAADQVLYEVRTMEQLASNSLERQRFLLLLFGIFASVALLLACIGIYGVLAYLTNQRHTEIGVRMAFGATAQEVLWLVLRQSLIVIGTGLIVGIPTALAACHLLKSFVQGVQSAQLSTFAITTVILVAAALFASFLPARRASQVDPMSALRQE